MSYSGDAAEQVVRMSLNGIEIAARISGKAAERLAALLYAVLKDQKRTKGKMRLTNMLRSGKELKVFAVKDEDLARFSKASKQYGVLYCALKDRKAQDGLTDVMVRAEDASKINRIFERFSLATIDMASVKTEIEKNREAGVKAAEEKETPERATRVNERVDEFMKKVVPETPQKEQGQSQNPTMARTERSDQSGNSSARKETTGKTGLADPGESRKKPSVRKELENIRKEQQAKKAPKRKQQEITHKAPKKKKRRETR